MQSPRSLWIVAVLCGLALLQQPALAEPEEADEHIREKHSACFEVCGDYVRWGYDCVLLAKCYDKQHTDEEAFVRCYEGCTNGGVVCQETCINHYDTITEACDDKCEEASIVDIFCENRCLKNDFKAQFGASLPDLTPQDVGVFQGVPGLEDDEEEEEVA